MFIKINVKTYKWRQVWTSGGINLQSRIRPVFTIATVAEFFELRLNYIIHTGYTGPRIITPLSNNNSSNFLPSEYSKILKNPGKEVLIISTREEAEICYNKAGEILEAFLCTKGKNLTVLQKQRLCILVDQEIKSRCTFLPNSFIRSKPDGVIIPNDRRFGDTR